MKLVSLSICLGLLSLACSAVDDGPVPEPMAVMPSLVCTAQGDSLVAITGSGFSPLVIDGLTDQASVLMPQVVFVAADSETEIPPAGVVLPTGSRDGTALEVNLPATLLAPTAAGADALVYDLKVINGNGNEGFLSSALTVVPPPELSSVQPVTGASGTTVSVTLNGLSFREGMTVTLDANPAVDGGGLILSDPTLASVNFDLTNVAPGVYSITVTNSEGCSSTLVDAFTVTQPIFFTLTGIDPPFGCACADTTVTISSSGGFVSTPTVQMRPTGQSGPVIDFERVAFIDANTLTAVVPAGAELGDYDITVINPPSEGSIGVLDSAFRVVALPIPTIEALSPSRGDPGSDTSVTVFGDNFRDTVTLELIDESLSVVATMADITPESPNELQATFPSNGLSEGVYLVRVTNNDESTYSTFSNFLVAAVGSSGNLHTFRTQSEMNTGRRMLAATQARDDNGNFYIYAVGGDTGDGGSVLRSVEVTQLSKFGELGRWALSRNELLTPRVGATALTVPIFDTSSFVPAKSYIYVIGGLDEEGTVLSSIERALVLSTDDAPSLDAAVGSVSGTLDAGTWYYKVSAVLVGSDPDNPGGETLASDEAIVTLGATGSVELSWNEVVVNGVAAAEYRVYRSSEVDGASQTELFVEAVAGTNFTDLGATVGIDEPLPTGSTGVWIEIAESMTTPRWGHNAAVVADSNGDRSIVILAGKNNVSDGYLGSVEVAAISDVDGSIAVPTTSGTNALPAARAFSSLVLETTATVSSYGAGTRIWMVGGVAASGSVFDIQTSEISTGGGNDAFIAATRSGNPVNGQEITGAQCVITGDKLFVVGGAAVADDSSVSNLTATGKDAYLDGSIELATPYNSAAATLAGGARALGVAVVGSGFQYFIGGTSDGSDALATTEKTF